MTVALNLLGSEIKQPASQMSAFAVAVGGKWTSGIALHMSAFDPKRT